MISPEFLYSLLETLRTGSGVWNPISWIIVFVVAFLVVYIVRGFGKEDSQVKGEKAKVFLSGNPELEKEKMHVGGSNLYWGFTDMLSWVYRGLDKMHNGNVSDYIFWFVIVLGIFFILLGVL